jgi:hypothetical protein
MNDDARIKIQMLKSSLRCFMFGLLGILPVVGLPFALAALVISGGVRVRERRLWNAARPYRILGTICAASGTIVWGFILTIVIYHAINDPIPFR